MKKGQYFRFLVGTSADPTSVIAAAKELSLHLSATTEEDSTKDTTGDAQEFDVTQLAYEITGSALVLVNDALLSGGESLQSVISKFQNTGQYLYWRISLMNGANNRTVETEICNGRGKFTNLQLNAQNKQNATYSFTFKGMNGIGVKGIDLNDTSFDVPIAQSGIYSAEDPMLVFTKPVSKLALLDGLTIKYYVSGSTGTQKDAVLVDAGDHIAVYADTDPMFDLYPTKDYSVWDVLNPVSSGPTWASFDMD